MDLLTDARGTLSGSDGCWRLQLLLRRRERKIPLLQLWEGRGRGADSCGGVATGPEVCRLRVASLSDVNKAAVSREKPPRRLETSENMNIFDDFCRFFRFSRLLSHISVSFFPPLLCVTETRRERK